MASRSVCMCAACSVAAALATGAAQAADPAASEVDVVLEEVIVTARKRVETLQDVPIAITALTQEVLEQAGIERVADLAMLVPNFVFQSGIHMGENHLALRGFSQIQNGPPPAAIVVDGVLLINPSRQFNVEEFDLERIEVLRGPQGALYGRNAIGGAINVVTRAPTEEFEVEGLVGYGRGDDFKARLSLSGPLVEDRLLARAAFSYRDREGQLRNETTGLLNDRYEDFSARARLLFMPAEAWELDLKFAYSDTKGGDPTYVALPDGHPNDNEEPIVADTIGNNPREVLDLSGRLSWTTGAGTLALTAAYLEGEESLFADFDLTAIPILTANRSFDDSGTSAELRFTSPDDRRFRWIAGAYYVDSRVTIDTLALADIGFFFDPPTPTGVVDFPVIDTSDRYDFRNHAGFAQIEYDFTQKLEVELALRYDDDEIELTSAAGSEQASFSKAQPKVTFNYRMADTSLVYASYGEGFRSGNFNPSEATIGEPVMRAESGLTFELGYKGRLFGNRATLNVAAFQTDLEDAQQQVLDFATGSNVGLNVDESTILGVEVELVAAVTDGLTLNLAGGWIDTEIDRFDADPTAVGNRLPRIPDYTINCGFTWQTPVGKGWDLQFRTDYNRQGESPWHVDNVDIRRAVDYLNARARVQTQDERFAISAWVKNALDDRTTQDFQAVEYSGHPLGIDAFSPVPGVTYGIELSTRF
jgi:iron complex outermembrane receptor protein